MLLKRPTPQLAPRPLVANCRSLTRSCHDELCAQVARVSGTALLAANADRLGSTDAFGGKHLPFRCWSSSSGSFHVTLELCGALNAAMIGRGAFRPWVTVLHLPALGPSVDDTTSAAPFGGTAWGGCFPRAALAGLCRGGAGAGDAATDGRDAFWPRLVVPDRLVLGPSTSATTSITPRGGPAWGGWHGAGLAATF